MSVNDNENNTNKGEAEVCIKLPPSLEASIPLKKKQQSTDEIKFLMSKEAKVQNILEALALTYKTRYLTNIDLQFGKRIVKEFETLSDILGNDTTLYLQIVARNYCTRDALKHVLTLREYLGFSSERVDGLSDFAVSTGSKFQELGLTDVKQQFQEEGHKTDEDNSKKRVLKISEEEKKDLEKTIKEIFVDIKHSSVTEVNATENSIITPCVRSLCLSPYNPVPPFYRSQGHLLYLQATTLEGEHFHITAVSSGFFINRSTATKFDPSPRDSNQENGNALIKHSLFDLLALNSKKLINHITSFEKKVKGLNPISYVKPVTSFLHKPWLISNLNNDNGDFMRLQLDSLSFETERNFNDEFQAIKDLPTETLQSRMDSEKLLTKIINEFTVVATRGAMTIFSDDFLAMNPDAPKEEQIFLKDNIFYSFVGDINGAFETKGGYDAAIASSNQDLRIINLLNRVGTQEIRYLLSTIVDFSGRRILAQTPVPGLLSTMGTKITKNEESGKEDVEDLPNDITVTYGFDEATGEVISNNDFDIAVKKELARVFHLRTHDVEGSSITLSSQSKGITGFDKRKYILDLANTCPLDINFVRKYYDGIESDTQYPHRQTLLRPELIEKWWQNKIKKENLEYKTAYDENKFSFNVDAYQVDGITDETVDEISDYLSDVVLPSIVEDYAVGNVTAPYNGEHIIENLHINGVNVRYLGKLVELAKKTLNEQTQKYEEHLKNIAEANEEHEEWEKKYLAKIESMIKERQEEINKYIQAGKDVPQKLKENIKLPEEDIRKPTKGEPFVVSKDELLPLIHVSEMEIIARSVKHILREHSRNIPVGLVPSFVAYVFNILFGINYNETPLLEKCDQFIFSETFDLSKLNRATLIAAIEKQAFLRFRYQLPSEWTEKHTSSPFALIRSICYQFGIQLVNKSYYFTKDQLIGARQLQDKKSKFVEPATTFTSHDIVIIPRVKSTKYDSVISDELWAQGAAMIEKDQDTALNILSQSVTIREDVSSTLHKTVAEKYLSLSTIYSNVGYLTDAVTCARKACMIYERVCGVDSFEVLRTLSNLAVLELSAENVLNTALIYKRIIAITQSFNLLETHHPIVINALNNLEQLALGIEDPRLAIDVLKQLSEIILSLDGPQSLAFAYVKSRIGNIYASLNIMPRALEHISVTKDIFVTQLGMNHELAVQAKQWNEGLNNLIKNKQNQKALQNEQIKTNGSDKKTQKNKDDVPDPKLASKTVDELLSFIEGDIEVKDESQKKSRTKKNKNKTKNKKK